MELFDKYINLVLESTYNINGDVNMLFRKYLRPLWTELTKKTTNYDRLDEMNLAAIDKIRKQYHLNTILQKIRAYSIDLNEIIGIADSSELQDHDCIKSHEVNPVTIVFTIKKEAFYSPKYGIIVIGISGDIIKASLSMRSGKKFDQLPEIVQKNLSNERRHIVVLSTIAHELSHWIDDSIHNSHVRKTIDYGLENVVKEKNIGDFNHHYIEINSQIAGIKAMKNKAGKEIWNEITLKKLFEISPSLSAVLRQTDYLNTKKKWLINLIRRMDREDLLGASMSYNEINDLLGLAKKR